MDVGSFIARLRRRKFVRWLAAYLAVAWALAQVFSLVGEQFDWPRTWQRLITVGLALGVLPAIVLAWFHGERGAQRVTRGELALLVGVSLVAATTLAFVARRQPEPATPQVVAASPKFDHRHVAVLPLENMGDAANAGFTDGVHDTLITQISRIPGLMVVSRTSVEHWKGSHPLIRDVARMLNVGTVLEGSVQRAGDKLRVQIQLIDAATDRHLWAEVYDRPADDLFAVQSEIADRVAQEVQIRLTASQRVALQHRPTQVPEAYDHYVLGRAHAASNHWEDAIREFTLAQEADPTFALAYADHAIAIWFHAHGNRPGDRAAMWEDARAAARRAIEIDPRLPEAHLARALLYYKPDFDYPAAEQEFRIALAGLPNDPRPMGYLSLLLRRQGRWEEAASWLGRAAELDPRNDDYADALIGANYALRRRADIERAEARLVAAHGGDPRYVAASVMVHAVDARAFDGDVRPLAAAARDYVERFPGSSSEAIDGWEALAALGDFLGAYGLVSGVRIDDPDLPNEYRVKIGIAQLWAGRKTEAAQTLARVRVRAEEVLEEESVPASQIWGLYARALADAAMGDKDSALATVRKADALLPIEADPIDGTNAWRDLVFVPALVGERATTWGLLRRFAAIRSFVTPQEIWCSPFANGLRTDPEFRAIMAAQGVDVTRGPGGEQISAAP